MPHNPFHNETQIERRIFDRIKHLLEKVEQMSFDLTALKTAQADLTVSVQVAVDGIARIEAGTVDPAEVATVISNLQSAKANLDAAVATIPPAPTPAS